MTTSRWQAAPAGVVAVTGAVLGVTGAVVGATPWTVAGAVVAVGWSAASLVALRPTGTLRLGALLAAFTAATGALTSAAGVISADPAAGSGPAGALRAVLVAVLCALGANVALALPHGSVTGRRAAVLLCWVAVAPLAVTGVLDRPAVPEGLLALTVVVLGLVSVASYLRVCRTASRVDRARLQWDAWGVLVGTAGVAAVWACWLLTGRPADWGPVALAVSVAVPAGLAASTVPQLRRPAATVLVHTIVAVGEVLVAIVVVVVVVVGLDGRPSAEGRGPVALALVAAGAALAAVLAVRGRLHEAANERIHGEREAPEEALRTFASRMSRSVPMDEVLLQLVESLRPSLDLSAAEVWTGADGAYERHVSVPFRDRRPLVMGPAEVDVAARARVVGNGWLAVWAPALLDGREDDVVRAAPISHLGSLLGFLVAERPAEAPPFDEDEDRVLGELSRQVGLALHNVRLDSALQASLAELQARNLELQASRARIVAAGDESRRRIERDLHDGAQQHLVAMAVKLGLARQLLERDPAAVEAVLEELRADVQSAVAELRELAHGIFPPLLRDRGLGEALRAAANRSPLPVEVDADDVGRLEPEVEAVVYFCCLEALQNAGKHAGDGATVAVAVTGGAGEVRFAVRDDGAGFDPTAAPRGHGFLNMEDRLGAVGGRLEVRSAPGAGTTVSGVVPVAPPSSEGATAPPNAGTAPGAGQATGWRAAQ